MATINCDPKCLGDNPDIAVVEHIINMAKKQLPTEPLPLKRKAVERVLGVEIID